RSSRRTACRHRPTGKAGRCDVRCRRAWRCRSGAGTASSEDRSGHGRDAGRDTCRRRIKIRPRVYAGVHKSPELLSYSSIVVRGCSPPISAKGYPSVTHSRYISRTTMALHDTRLRTLKPQPGKTERLIADVNGLYIRMRRGEKGEITRTWQFR